MADVIGRGEYSKSLKNAFGLTGRTPFALASEIVPVASLGDLDGPPYHRKRGFAHGVSRAAVVGQHSWCVIRMPAGTTDIGVMRRCGLCNDSGVPPFGWLTPLVAADLPAGLTFTSITEDWDVRGVNSSSYNVASPLVAVGTSASAAISRHLRRLLTPAYTFAWVEEPFVFTADHWLAMVTNAQNVHAEFNWYGDVYPGG